MSLVVRVHFTDYRSSVRQALDPVAAADRLPQTGLILLKPNLTNADPPPVTTPAEFVEAVYLYCRDHTAAEIAIAEGCGDGTTQETYDANGYSALAKKYGLRLIDFNEEEAMLLKDGRAYTVKEFYLPKIAQDAFVISLPILKDHCFTDTTIAMKNMFGLAPASYYAGSWNKSKLHSPSTHKSVVDVCLYKKPDLCVVDAVVALQGMHLSGTPKKLNTILAGFDPVAVDAVGSRMLGHNPKKIEYLKLADGLLGSMKDVEIIEN